MRIFRFSLILFLTIIISSVFCSFYIRDNLSFYNIYLKNIESIDKNIEMAKKEYALLKSDFYTKKDMLQKFINKEHINEIEKNILLIENAINNNELTECQNLSIETQCLITQIIDYTTAID